jgi:hypothetical protein
MGTNHCQFSSCATVHYRPYESRKVRWRYGAEPWQEYIGADDYSITPTFNRVVLWEWQYDMGYSILSYGLVIPSSPSQGCNGSLGQLSRCARRYENPQVVFTPERIQAGFYPPIYKYRISDFAQADLPCSNAALNYLPLLCTRPEGYRKVEIFAHKTASSPNPEWITGWLGTRNYTPGYMLQVPSGGEYPVVYNPATNKYVGVLPSGAGWGYFNFVPTANVAPTAYLLKIFKNGQKVYQQTRTTSPNVEIIPCSLSSISKAIKIKKLPFLQRIDVVPYGYNYVIPDPNGQSITTTYDIPPECLTIWNVPFNLPSAYGNISDGGLSIPLSFIYIGQICSAPGCPPPAYEVICDCCQVCPDGTCPIECGDEICCYNDYGVSVQTIPKSDFCGGAIHEL